MWSIDTLKNEMKRLLSLLILCTFSICAFAQVLKERRVYYLDCSYSMVKPNDIWDQVCDNLINAINKIEDETTELVVVPFAFDNKHHANLNAYQEKATSQGKANLINNIKSIEPIISTKTYHSDALKDFYNRRVSPNRVNYMFFMTDGQNEEYPDPMPGLIKMWGNKFAGKNVYGFYVMLHDSAANKNIENMVTQQPQLWKVETADVNINLVRLQSKAIFNARNDKYFDLPIYGDASGKSFSASFPTSCPYKVKKTEKKSKALRIWVVTPTGQKLPESSDYSLNVKMIGGGDFDFLVTEEISVKCEFKKERSLKISVR